MQKTSLNDLKKVTTMWLSLTKDFILVLKTHTVKLFSIHSSLSKNEDCGRCKIRGKVCEGIYDIQHMNYVFYISKHYSFRARQTIILFLQFPHELLGKKTFSTSENLAISQINLLNF